MKKILLLFLIVAAASCSKESEEVNLTKSDLIGTWGIISTSVEGNKVELDECSSKENIKFTKDVFLIKIALWEDAWNEKDCKVYTIDHEFKLDGKYIEIKNDGDVVYYSGTIINSNTIKIRSNYYDSDFYSVSTYRKN